MNRIRRLAEELVTRYPNLFGPDFDKNKEALAQVTVVRTRSVRNQLAGAITKIVHERGPTVSPATPKTQAEEQVNSGEAARLATIEERARIEGTPVPKIASESTSEVEKQRQGQLHRGRDESTKSEGEQPAEQNTVISQ